MIWLVGWCGFLGGWEGRRGDVRFVEEEVGEPGVGGGGRLGVGVLGLLLLLLGGIGFGEVGMG